MVIRLSDVSSKMFVVVLSFLSLFKSSVLYVSYLAFDLNCLNLSNKCELDVSKLNR